MNTLTIKRHPKPFTEMAAVVFALVAILQLLRFLMRWEIVIDGRIIPVWLSGVVAVVIAALAVMVWREARS